MDDQDRELWDFFVYTKGLTCYAAIHWLEHSYMDKLQVFRTAKLFLDASMNMDCLLLYSIEQYILKTLNKMKQTNPYLDDALTVQMIKCNLNNTIDYWYHTILPEFIFSEIAQL